VKTERRKILPRFLTRVACKSPSFRKRET